MSAEAWRHSGTDVAPRSFAWQACLFQHLGLECYFLHLHRRQRKLGDILGLMWRRGLLRGRRVTFNTSGSSRLKMFRLKIQEGCSQVGDRIAFCSGDLSGPSVCTVLQWGLVRTFCLHVVRALLIWNLRLWCDLIDSWSFNVD